MKEEELKKLIGKTIANIVSPDVLEISEKREGETPYETTGHDDNLVITFTDGTVLKLASWDCEGYSSGIYKQIL